MAVVLDLQGDRVAVGVQAQPGRAGSGVLDDVLQRLLGDAVDGRGHVGGQLARAGFGVHLELRDGPGQALQAGGQPQVVEHRRVQAGDGEPGFVQGRLGQLLRGGDLPGGDVRPGGHRVGGRGQVKGQAHHALADAVVDLAREPAAFGLLGQDDPLGEPLHGLLAFGQHAVQPRVLDGPRHQSGHPAEQFHVRAGELPAMARVHVEHADQAVRLTVDGHAGQRGEVFLAQRG